MTDWVPVSTIIGNVTAAPAAPAATGFGAGLGPAAQTGNLPPKMHWAVLLVLGIVTLSIFLIIWVFIQAAWVRKVRPQSKVIFYLVGYLVCAFGAVPFGQGGISVLLRLGGLVLFLVGIFAMRSDIEEYYGMVTPSGRSLSGVMTFFFNTIYFQYVLMELRETMENSACAAATA